MKKHVLADISLLIVTIIWGSTFVLCKIALQSMETFSFLAVRFFIASAILALIFWKNLSRLDKNTLKNGLIIGLIMFFAFATQTLGIYYTTPSKAGFITGFTVLLVPLISTLLFKKPPRKESLIGIVFAITGIVFLTMGSGGELSVSTGDIIVFVSTFGYALQIIAISHYSTFSDSINLSIIQIGVVAVLSAVFALIFENPQIPTGAPVWTSILLTAVLATAVAFTIQNTMQKHTTPTRAALIYLGEPVFSAMFSYMILGEVLSPKGVFGCALIFFGMIVSEVKMASLFKKPSKASGRFKKAS
ncbi:Permease of the drug/metabolite transporter (DMT) superfamily [Peptoclostridium litorale DSM 5388]|uniref:EamA domain-containing protein n=1 Tax=Peptoclostridium litorale DSM 5388 TaxID=1121324 RepID=A0A069RFX3_PEPLI|nr:DMT family transporter [Peptoclostridium litorale]KDR95693.1 hypothetical protein CLIT_10c04200 [Peptoclostridium litorale DSM 5388]SIO01242.1 Permease of the drug/metabolite transporter (DMT) superfamily [Peptoclostridium litorale DSM 5388]